jgi:hypothetical protein
LTKAGLLTSLRFCFAFFGLDERYRDVTTVGLIPVDNFWRTSYLDSLAHKAQLFPQTGTPH